MNPDTDCLANQIVQQRAAAAAAEPMPAEFLAQWRRAGKTTREAGDAWRLGRRMRSARILAGE